jgi:hypothetical protein
MEMLALPPHAASPALPAVFLCSVAGSAPVLASVLRTSSDVRSICSGPNASRLQVLPEDERELLRDAAPHCARALFQGLHQSAADAYGQLDLGRHAAETAISVIPKTAFADCSHAIPREDTPDDEVASMPEPVEPCFSLAPGVRWGSEPVDLLGKRDARAEPKPLEPSHIEFEPRCAFGKARQRRDRGERRVIVERFSQEALRDVRARSRRRGGSGMCNGGAVDLSVQHRTGLRLPADSSSSISTKRRRSTAGNCFACSKICSRLCIAGFRWGVRCNSSSTTAT